MKKSLDQFFPQFLPDFRFRIPDDPDMSLSAHTDTYNAGISVVRKEKRFKL